jgi:ADP-ribosyltransferase exoenzyme
MKNKIGIIKNSIKQYRDASSTQPEDNDDTYNELYVGMVDRDEAQHAARKHKEETLKEEFGKKPNSEKMAEVNKIKPKVKGDFPDERSYIKYLADKSDNPDKVDFTQHIQYKHKMSDFDPKFVSTYGSKKEYVNNNWRKDLSHFDDADHYENHKEILKHYDENNGTSFLKRHIEHLSKLPDKGKFKDDAENPPWKKKPSEFNTVYDHIDYKDTLTQKQLKKHKEYIAGLPSEDHMYGDEKKVHELKAKKNWTKTPSDFNTKREYKKYVDNLDYTVHDKHNDHLDWLKKTNQHDKLSTKEEKTNTQNAYEKEMADDAKKSSDHTIDDSAVNDYIKELQGKANEQMHGNHPWYKDEKDSHNDDASYPNQGYSSHEVFDGIRDIDKRWRDHYDSFNSDHLDAISGYTLDSSEFNKALYTGAHKHDGETGPHPRMYHMDEKEWRYKGYHMQDANLSDAMKVHGTPEDTHVYSGIGWSPEMFAKPGQKGPIKAIMKAYTSTSLSKYKASGFGGGIDSEHNAKAKKVKVNKIDWNHPDPEGYLDHTGDYPKSLQEDETETPNNKHIIRIHVPKGSHGAYVEKHTNISGEYEFLMHKNAKLHIHPKPEIVDHGNYRGDAQRTIVWHAKLVHDGVAPTRHMKDYKAKKAEIESEKGT